MSIFWIFKVSCSTFFADYSMPDIAYPASPPEIDHSPSHSPLHSPKRSPQDGFSPQRSIFLKAHLKECNQSPRKRHVQSPPSLLAIESNPMISSSSNIGWTVAPLHETSSFSHSKHSKAPAPSPRVWISFHTSFFSFF